jgi:hypothetical protein
VARDEHHREDLLAEATALVERAELTLAGDAEPIVAGFRRDGSLSIYFGDDPAFHFNSAGELRRAYNRGRIYKAERRKLVALERRRVTGEVQLIRHEMTADEASAFLKELGERIKHVQSALAQGDWRLVGQVPASSDVVARIRRWLEHVVLPPPIAASPRAG